MGGTRAIPDLPVARAGCRCPRDHAARQSDRSGSALDPPDRLPGRAQLLDDRIEIVDPEVDHPGVLVRPDHLGVLREGREDRRSRFLAPDLLVVGVRNRRDPEPLQIPACKALGIPRPKEEATNSGDTLHAFSRMSTRNGRCLTQGGLGDRAALERALKCSVDHAQASALLGDEESPVRRERHRSRRGQSGSDLRLGEAAWDGGRSRLCGDEGCTEKDDELQPRTERVTRRATTASSRSNSVCRAYPRPLGAQPQNALRTTARGPRDYSSRRPAVSSSRAPVASAAIGLGTSGSG